MIPAARLALGTCCRDCAPTHVEWRFLAIAAGKTAISGDFFAAIAPGVLCDATFLQSRLRMAPEAPEPSHVVHDTTKRWIKDVNLAKLLYRSIEHHVRLSL